MRRPEFLARQGRCPSGFLGAVVGRIMARETAVENAIAVDLLRLEPTNQVLEVGFGHGRTVGAIATQVPKGFVAGIDSSTEMLRLATRANREGIASGRIALKLGDSQTLPYVDGRFDQVLTVHTVYFWQDLSAQFSELRRVVRPGGLLVLGFRPEDESTAAGFPVSVYTFRPAGQICSALEDAGFAEIELTESRSSGRRVAFIRTRSRR